MALLQAVWIGLVALTLAPGWLFYFDVTPKAVALMTGAAAALLLYGAVGLSAKVPAEGFGTRVSGLGFPQARWFDLLLLLSLASLTLSTALSTNPALSTFGSTWRRFGLVEQTAVLVLALTVRPGVTLLRGICIVSGLTALYGIGQYFGWDPILPAASYHIGEGVWTIVRPPGTLGYVSYFATWLLMTGFLNLWLAENEPNPRWKQAAYGAAALCFTAMLLTGTRAAVLGLAAGGAVWLWRSGFRIPRRVWIVGALVAAAAAVFYFSPAGWSLRSRSRWFAEDPWGGARPLLWRDSLRMGVNRPAAGFGPEVFTANFPHYESRELARAYPDFAHESPHNIFLDALVAQGVPGLLSLAGLCGLAAVSAWRAKHGWLLAALVSGLVAQQFTAFTIPTAVIFYATLGMCMDRSRTVTAPKWVRWSGLPLVASFVYCAIRLTAADHALERAREATDPQIAAVYYADYANRRFPGTSADLWYSRRLLELAQSMQNPVGRLQAAGAAGMAARRATETAEDPFDAWYNLATFYAAQNDAKQTENALRRAIDAHPNWFKPHWTLAQLLRLEGRLPEAAAEASTAADLDGGKDPEVAATLAQIRALQK